jgi:hypothetical protein
MQVVGWGHKGSQRGCPLVASCAALPCGTGGPCLTRRQPDLATAKPGPPPTGLQPPRSRCARPRPRRVQAQEGPARCFFCVCGRCTRTWRPPISCEGARGGGGWRVVGRHAACWMQARAAGDACPMGAASALPAFRSATCTFLQWALPISGHCSWLGTLQSGQGGTFGCQPDWGGR